jgi:hypothetical protein
MRRLLFIACITWPVCTALDLQLTQNGQELSFSIPDHPYSQGMLATGKIKISSTANNLNSSTLPELNFENLKIISTEVQESKPNILHIWINFEVEGGNVHRLRAQNLNWSEQIWTIPEKNIPFLEYNLNRPETLDELAPEESSKIGYGIVILLGIGLLQWLRKRKRKP